MAWALAAAAVLLAAAGFALALWHRRALRVPAAPPAAPVTLLLAATGDSPGLAALFDALAAQQFRPRRLVLCVESRWDPVRAQAEALAGRLPCPLEVAEAGETAHAAQKCANLAAGLARVDAEDRAVVVLDADIRPQPFWLGALVGPVLDGRYDLVSGYRWLQPGGAGWGAQLVAWLDRGLALLPKLPQGGFVWGGSIAYSPGALARLDLPALYARHLSDDLAAGARAQALGLRLLTRRALLVPVPGAARALGFYRRQAQFAWRYMPGVTLGALALSLTAAAGWVALAGLVAAGEAAAMALALAGLAARAGAWHLHGRIAAALAMPDPPAARRRQLLPTLLPVLPALGFVLIALAALPARRLRWRGITYAVAGRDRVRVIARDRWEAPPPCPVTGADGSVRVGTLPTTVLRPLWRWTMGAWPTPLAPGQRLGCWRSPAGLVFFHPMREGDAAFYTTLYRANRFGERTAAAAAMRIEFREAARHIPPGAAVLELGAGTGGFVGHLPPGARHVGLDPHAAAYSDAAPTGLRAETIGQHAAAHPGAYDVACAFQVIEHLADPVGAVRDMLRCLRPGGLVILVVPLWPSALTRIPNFPISLPPHHLTWWNEAALAALAAAAGAELVEARTLPPSPHAGRLHWMARLGPLRPADTGPWFQPRWSWHLGLLAAAALSWLPARLRALPPGAGPIDVMLVARRPAGRAPSAADPPSAG